MVKNSEKIVKKTTAKKSNGKKVESIKIEDFENIIVESKAEKFVKLFRNRTNKLLHQMVNIGKLANSSNYDIEKEFVENGLQLIDDELADLKHKFNLVFTKESRRAL